MSVRELRLHWPAVEKRLRATGSLTVTRDNVPVATLVTFDGVVSHDQQQRFDANEHMRWLASTWSGKLQPPSSDEMLREERGEE